MTENFDVIVIGMGPGGEVAATEMLEAGKRVAVIERELIGGECGYWACIPSKTLLRPAEAKVGVSRAEGVGGAALDWPPTRDYGDTMIRHLDDSKQVTGYEKSGATVIKGAAHIHRPGPGGGGRADAVGRARHRRDGVGRVHSAGPGSRRGCPCVPTARPPRCARSPVAS